MAIKMRNNTDVDSVCCECGESRKEVLDMFDVCVGGKKFTICDRCNNVLLFKTLKAECLKNGRVKSSHDMAIIRRRGQRDYHARWRERNEQGKRTEFNGEE